VLFNAKARAVQISHHECEWPRSPAADHLDPLPGDLEVIVGVAATGRISGLASGAVAIRMSMATASRKAPKNSTIRLKTTRFISRPLEGRRRSSIIRGGPCLTIESARLFLPTGRVWLMNRPSALAAFLVRLS
jgi:hypothetical protein